MAQNGVLICIRKMNDLNKFLTDCVNAITKQFFYESVVVGLRLFSPHSALTHILLRPQNVVAHIPICTIQTLLLDDVFKIVKNVF